MRSVRAEQRIAENFTQLERFSAKTVCFNASRAMKSPFLCAARKKAIPNEGW